MINWLTSSIQLVALLLAAWYLVDTLRKRMVSRANLIALAVLGVMLLVQLVVSIVLLLGQEASGDMVMFIGYLATIVLVVPVAGFWGRIDQSHWGTAVLCGAGVTVAALMLRMSQIWSLIVG